MHMRVKPDTEILLEWYDEHKRTLPWRAMPGEYIDPYSVWLSEIMLQQTTVAAVIPYYEKFLSKWPTVGALAGADLDEVLSYWAGLGYYARARNLHSCAKIVQKNYGGKFPATQKELMALPGIGDYTSAAITSIAFEKRAIVVDANIERVIARVYGLDLPLPKIKTQIKKIADELTPFRRFGDYAQGVMDLGSLVCKPRKPSCDICPWKVNCRAKSMKLVEVLPRKPPKRVKPTRYGVCFWVESPNGAVLVRKRPESGLLGGMLEIPSSTWQEVEWSHDDLSEADPISLDSCLGSVLPGIINHTFSHFNLKLEIHIRLLSGNFSTDIAVKGNYMWLGLSTLNNYAFPSVMKKVIRHVLQDRKLEN